MIGNLGFQIFDRLVTITLCSMVLIGLLSCENDLKEVNRLIEQQDLNTERAENVLMLYSDSAIVRVRIAGPVMLNYIDKDNPRKEFPEGVEVDFYNKAKEIETKITAKYALRLDKKDKVILRDSVEVWNIGGEKLKTEELIWDERKKKIYSDKYVKIIRPKEIVYGYGFKSNQDFTEGEIRDVEGIIEVDNLIEGMED